LPFTAEVCDIIQLALHNVYPNTRKLPLHISYFQEKAYTEYIYCCVSGCEVKEKGGKQVRIGNNLTVMYQIIRRLWGKCGELEMLLETEINSVETLCFTEHWLNCHKIHAININNFTLFNAFS
jgi:hypothetical protein